MYDNSKILLLREFIWCKCLQQNRANTDSSSRKERLSRYERKYERSF